MLFAARRKCLRLTGRTFHSSLIHKVTDGGDPLKTVSKKEYANLPATKLLSDGSGAIALQDWNGGLEHQGNSDVNGLSVFIDQDLKACGKRPKLRRTSSSLAKKRKTVKDVTISTGTAADNVKTRLRERFQNTIHEFLGKEATNGQLNHKPSTPLSQPPHTTEVKTRPQNQLAREISDNLARFPHCILLTRVGNFYESYFEQAAEVAHLLSIKLTKRTWDKQEVLMCGFPIMHLDKYLKILVQQNKRLVALCEEFKKDAPEEGFERRVVRVLSPGTLVEETIINPHENNYLLAVSGVSNLSLSSFKREIGLAWIDVSTGEFFTQKSRVEHLKDDLARISPREVVLSSEIKNRPNDLVHQIAVADAYFISFCTPHQSDACSFSSPATEDNINFSEAKSSLSTPEVSAIGLLTSFLRDHLLEHMPLLSYPSQQSDLTRMHIDSHTLKSLEIREGMREGGTTGSLLNVIKRTVTNSGTRLLTRWLCSPSTSISEIRSRQNLVSFFIQHPYLRNDIVHHLRRLEDTFRIVQRFLLRKGDVSDLLAIKETINLWKIIKSRIESEIPDESIKEQYSTFRHLLNNISDMTTLASRIELAVENQPLNNDGTSSFSEVAELSHSDGNLNGSASLFGHIKPTIRASFSPELASLHTQLLDSHVARRRLEKELQERFAAPSLTLRLSGKMGVHVHVGKPIKDAEKIESSPHFVVLSSSGSSKTFFNQTWYILGSKIIDITVQIMAAERDAFDILRHEVKTHVLYLRKNARIMDELDVITGFAQLAEDLRLVKPMLDESTKYEVVNGRHPSVEMGLLCTGRTFTPNTVSLSSTSRIHIITGPNMAGKSTILRQTAVIVILAQIGSFVPADDATVGVVDRLFSRIGAKDDLFRDRSTFMVEMLETADILKNATDKSLVIMDEVGRGTTVHDGLAIAFAAIYHLYRFNRSRVLFATHFHQLADMLGYSESKESTSSFKEINFFCTDVHATTDGHFTYSHRLKPGVNRDSHGLKVAALAGIPSLALTVAEDTLRYIKEFNNSSQNMSYFKDMIWDITSKYN